MSDSQCFRRIEGSLDSPIKSAQILPGNEPPKMKFPKVIRHRKAGVTSYGQKPNYPFYRNACQAEIPAKWQLNDRFFVKLTGRWTISHPWQNQWQSGGNEIFDA